MTQLAADFAAKGLLILMTSSPVATGLAYQYSSFDLIKPSLGERCSDVYMFFLFVWSDHLIKTSSMKIVLPALARFVHLKIVPLNLEEQARRFPWTPSLGACY